MTNQTRAFDTTEPHRPTPDNGDRRQRTAVQRSLTGMGIELTPYAFEIVVSRVITLTRGPEEPSDLQVRSIVHDVVSSTETFQQGVAESFR